MTSEIRTNSITSRAGMSTVTMTDSGPMFSGITTFVDNSGFTFGVGGGTSIFTPATNVLTFGTNNTEKIRIDASGHMHGVGVITATHFYGDGSNLTGLPAGTTINNNANNRVITGSDTSNTLIAETGLTYNTQTLLLNNTSANPQFHLTSAANGICEVKFGDANDATRGNIVYRNGTSGEALCFHGYNNTERMRIDSSGHVLIGKTSGDHILDINASSDEIRLTKASASDYNGIQLDRDASGNAGGYFGLAGATNHYINGAAQHDICVRSQSNLLFSTNGADERLRITSDGKIGIGINNPLKQLHVFKSNEHPVMFERGDTSNTIIELKTNGATRGYWGCSTTANFIVYDNDASDVNFIVNQDGTFSGRPDQINGRTTNEVLGGKSFKYTTSNISPSWGSGSNGWYSFYHMSDGMYTFWLQTNAHSSICFTASNGYDPSNKSFINVHQFINNPNGNYGNVKGIRITNDGIVQVYLHASASNQYFTMHVQVTCGDLENMPPLYATITKETGSPTINDSWGTADAYSPAQGAHTTDGVCSPRILHNRREMSCFATSTSLYGANTSGAKGFYWDPDTASCQSAQPRNTGWSSYYINKHDGNGGSENRYIDFWLNNGQQGNITISGSGLNYGSNSDYRLKKDEVVMTDGIARVKQLRPLKFKWIKDDIDDEGFFAHEAQAVVPIAVDGTKDQVVLQSEVDAGSQRENKSAGDPIYQTMDNSKLVPVLTASIKELITKVETLEQDNIALRARVTNLEGN